MNLTIGQRQTHLQKMVTIIALIDAIGACLTNRMGCMDFTISRHSLNFDLMKNRITVAPQAFNGDDVQQAFPAIYLMLAFLGFYSTAWDSCRLSICRVDSTCIHGGSKGGACSAPGTWTKTIYYILFYVLFYSTLTTILFYAYILPTIYLHSIAYLILPLSIVPYPSFYCYLYCNQYDQIYLFYFCMNGHIML